MSLMTELNLFGPCKSEISYGYWDFFLLIFFIYKKILNNLKSLNIFVLFIKYNILIFLLN